LQSWLQGAGLSQVVSGFHDIGSAPAKPTVKIWSAACASQGPLYAAHGAVRRIRRAAECDPFSFKPIAIFSCLVMAAELISLYEDYIQST
jgi:hypothetical protein